MNFENLKVLLVDDDKFARIFLANDLRELGFQSNNLKQAGDGVEALQILENFSPDLIITDYNMPYMNGIDFVKKVKENPQFKKIPIVFYTGEGSILYYCLREGIEALSLPLAPSKKELIETLEDALKKDKEKS